MTTTQAQQAIAAIRSDLRAALFERGDAIDGMLTALLAGEHAFIIGPPGTAKSALAKLMCAAIDGAEFFATLVTKFSVPEELFGPMSVKGLTEDRYERKTDGMLPQAHVAFLDEIFKANSAILNSTLTLINEREFHNGGNAQRVPLLSMVAASNELPEGVELEALFDRFLCRYFCGSIQDRSNLKAMLLAADPAISSTITLDLLAQAQAEAQALPMSDALVDTLIDCKIAVEQAGVVASDRRWKKIPKALRCYAYLCGDSQVTEDHFDLLADLLWREPKERSALAQVIGKVANPMAAKATEIMDAARELFGSLPNGGARKAEFLAAAAEANAEFENMEAELATLIQSNPGKDRKLREAMDVVQRVHKDTQRAAAKAAGISL